MFHCHPPIVASGQKRFVLYLLYTLPYINTTMQYIRRLCRVTVSNPKAVRNTVTPYKYIQPGIIKQVCIPHKRPYTPQIRRDYDHHINRKSYSHQDVCTFTKSNCFACITAPCDTQSSCTQSLGAPLYPIACSMYFVRTADLAKLPARKIFC